MPGLILKSNGKVFFGKPVISQFPTSFKCGPDEKFENREFTISPEVPGWPSTPLSRLKWLTSLRQYQTLMCGRMT